MKISFEEGNMGTTFRITGYDKRIENVLKMCFYQTDENSYYKVFPKGIQYIENIKNHYRNNAEEMFLQLGYYKPIPWEKALLEFIKKIEAIDIDWWLTGSCATCIRGISLNPHDVDIMIDSKDVNKIRDHFCNYIIEPIIDTNGWLTKDFGVLFMHTRIDIASDPDPSLDHPEPSDCGPYAKSHLEIVKWHGFDIKVPLLQLQLNANKKRRRFERVKLIETFIKNQKTK